jgi:LysM domain
MTRMSARPGGRFLALALLGATAGAACIPPSGRVEPTTALTAPADSPTPLPSPSGPSTRPSFVRPTPTPLPTFLVYTVRPGDTLTSIARTFRTTARSIAFWNRTSHPSLDPDSPQYEPDRIDAGWDLVLVPDVELDPEDLPAASTAPPPSASPS